MLEYDQYRLEIENLAEPLGQLKSALHISRIDDEASELEARAMEPGFWDDAERAQKIQTKIIHLRRKVEHYNHLENQREELLLLCELGNEADDRGLLGDVKSGLEQLKTAMEKLRLETLLIGEYDDHNAILTLHAGAGGTEAQDWCEMLYRMYSRWAGAHGFDIKVVDILDGDEAGLKSVSIQVNGENAYGYLRSEIGVHRLVRISPFDSSGRRHTSFASCEVIPELDDTINIEIRPEDIRMDVYRASGAGGQHVNKTSSAVRLTHLPTGIVTASQAERSQFQNRDNAMSMMKAKLFALAKAANMERIEDLKGDQMEIAWGSQIRSYVFMPYTMVKDHRTNAENSDVNAVMDGELDDFIFAYLKMNSQSEREKQEA